MKSAFLLAAFLAFTLVAGASRPAAIVGAVGEPARGSAQNGTDQSVPLC